MSRHAPSDCKVYVGDLGSTASKADLEDAFTYYGPLRNVWVARNPPGFAFVEFEDARDAEDAIRALDGRMVCGRRIRVEPSNGANKGRFGQGGSRSRWHPEDRCYDCGDRGHYARDCPRDRRYGNRRRSRSRSRDRRSKSRSESRSRSRSKSRSKRSRSRRKSRSRSRSNSRSRSRGSDKRSASRSRSRSRTKDTNHKGENGKAD